MPNDSATCPPQPAQATCDCYPIAERRLSQVKDDRVDIEDRLCTPVDVRRGCREAFEQLQDRSGMVAPTLGQQQVVSTRRLP